MAFYTILTDIGKAKLANATSLGDSVSLKEIAVGDGGGVATSPQSDDTALTNEVWRADLNNISIDSSNANWIVCEGYIPSDVGDFTVREVGLFDVDGDMIAIGNYPDTYKPTLDSGSAKDLYIKVIIEVSDSDVVELKIDPSVVLSTRKYVDDLYTSIIDNINGFKNQIINGGFNVWQRGESFSLSSGNAGYISDRMYTEVSTENTGTLDISKSELLFDGTYNSSSLFNSTLSGYTAMWLLAQPIENYKAFPGRTFTVSFVAKSNLTHTKMLYSIFRDIKNSTTNQVIIGSYAIKLIGDNISRKYSFTFDSTNISHLETTRCMLLGITLGTDESHTFEIAQLQLEEGSVATPFEQRPYGLELSLCQRYYEKLAVGHFRYYTATATSIVPGSIFKTEKRVVPSITLYPSFDFTGTPGHINIQSPDDGDYEASVDNLTKYSFRVNSSEYTDFTNSNLVGYSATIDAEL